jgi:hypothetical protein
MNTLKPKEEHMIILSMIAKNHTQTEIARKLNTTGGNISQKVKVLIKYGLLVSRRTLSERGKDAVLAYKIANNRPKSQKATPNPTLASSMPLNASRPQPVATKPQIAQQAARQPQAQTMQEQIQQQQILDKQKAELAAMLIELGSRNYPSSPPEERRRWVVQMLIWIFSLPENDRIVEIAKIKKEYNKPLEVRALELGLTVIQKLFGNSE